MHAERSVIDSEKKFRKLFNSTMDTIIEIDREFNITRINDAGEHLFGAKPAEINGKTLSTFFAAADFMKIKTFVSTLERLSENQQRLWIPGRLTVKNRSGERFPAEGTLSRFSFGRDWFYILILRSEKEKHLAEQKIRSMSVEAEYLKEEVRKQGNYTNIIGSSTALQLVLEKVAQVAGTDATVLITGETGTGKEAIARAIHSASGRSEKPLITINCAAIPATLIESEFFGHEKGSFTGATAKRLGRFALADQGTIFLDEIGELPIDMQAKLLRVLLEGTFEPIGSSATVHTDVRIIAATNRYLPEEIAQGSFREDLYYRLNVFPLLLPPLRERGEDVIELAIHFINYFSSRMARPEKPLNQEDILLLKSYDWPGNIRELQNVIERAVIVSVFHSRQNLRNFEKIYEILFLPLFVVNNRINLIYRLNFPLRKVARLLRRKR